MSQGAKREDLHADGNRGLRLVFSLDGRMEVSREKGELMRWLGATVHECTEDRQEGLAQITSLSFVWSEVEETYWKELHRTRNELSATIRTTSLPFFDLLSSIRPGVEVVARLSIWEPDISDFHIEMPYDLRHPVMAVPPRTTWRSFFDRGV